MSIQMLAPGRCAASLAFAALISGCSSGGSPCLGDSESCVKQRVTMYEQMAADPQRQWIDRPVTREEYASGVRLFAWRSSKDKLSCAEIGKGVQEMDAAKRALANGPLPGQSAEMLNRVKALTDDTRIELANTARKRGCG